MIKAKREIARRRIGKQILRFLLLLITLCFGAKMPDVRAQTASAPASHGNLIYEGKRGSAALYAVDILLLEEKISTIPEKCFDPACYAHTHNWEYCRINERTHTRHCAECGDANDLTGSHRADSWERDTIFYEGKSYPGKRFTCACGYQWRMEMNHTPIYEAVDEVNHQGKCALGGTPYCLGCEVSVEEHYVWYYEMGEDECHHMKICLDCGFRMEETCSFEEAEENETLRVCVCGRSVKQEESDTPEEPDTSDTPETEDEEEEPDMPETGDEEEEADTPETGEAEGEADTPETGEAEGEADTSETGDTPGEQGDEGLFETGGDPESKEVVLGKVYWYTF